MNILAIETSCDETSVAIVRDGRHILANVIASQIGLHTRFGGVVPELASRQHIITLIPTLEEAFRRAGLDWAGIDAIAVTAGPGLAGALLVGLNAAKALAFAREKPLIAVNHLEAHIYSNWIVPEGADPPRLEPRAEATPPAAPTPAPEKSRASLALRALGLEPPADEEIAALPTRRPVGGRPQFAPPVPTPPAESHPDSQRTEPTDPTFPLIGLVVSGGHTELIYMSGHGQYSLLGKTVDDAAGEAFDKVARILGLSYPGGPSIQRAAQEGDPDAIELPRVVLRGSYDFSFSGLKTATLRQTQAYGPPLTDTERAAATEAARQAEIARRAEEERREEQERIRHADEERRQQEEEERRRAAEERERRAAEIRAHRAAEERLRREEEEREEERLRREDAGRARRLAEERARPAAQSAERPPAEEPPLPRPPATGRPAISILGGSRPEPAPAPAPPPPAGPAPAPRPGRGPHAAEPPAAPPRGTSPLPPKKPRAAGLIRVTSTEVPDAAPPAEGDAAIGRHFERQPTPPIVERPERDAPRVLGKSAQEEIAPPPFLAERGGGIAPTPLRRRPAPPAEPEAPAFLRERNAPPAVEPPAAKTPPRKPAGAHPPAAEEPPPARLTPAATRPAAPIPPPVPPPAPARPSVAPPPTPTRSTITPAPTSTRPAPATPPAPTRPAPPTPPPGPRPTTEASPQLPNTPARPTPPTTPARPPAAPPPQPLRREARPIPKSVQAGRAPRAEDDEVDEALADLLDNDTPDTRKKRGEGPRGIRMFDDEDLGTDDDDGEPPPRKSRKPLSLDGPRPPEARVPVDRGGKPPLPVADFAASFQAAAVEILVEKTVSAAVAYKVRTVLLAGGVAANLRLRDRLRERLGPDIVLRSPPSVLCTDNAAMVAAAAYFRYEAGLQTGWALDIDPNARYIE